MKSDVNDRDTTVQDINPEHMTPEPGSDENEDAPGRGDVYVYVAVLVGALVLVGLS